MRLYETGKPNPPTWKVLGSLAISLAFFLIAAVAIIHEDWKHAAMFAFLTLTRMIEHATDQILDRIDLRADGRPR